MLSVAEAARRAGKDPETIRRWIRAGKLTAWKVGGHHVIDEDDLSDAARGIFTSPGPPGERGLLGTSAEIVAAVHRDRAERSHEIREATAPYLERHADPGPATSVAVDTALPHIVGRIVRAVDPSRIILFGPRVRGAHQPDSDYDLVVVLDHVGERRLDRVTVRRSFTDLPVSASILIASIDEIEGRIPGRPMGQLYWALLDGLTVYDRDIRG